MKDDLEELTAYNEHDGEMVNDFQEARLNSEPPPLQRPWALMAHNDLRSYLVSCIMTTYWRAGGTKPRIQYFNKGGLAMKPAWWLEHEFSWTLLSNVSKKLNYTGPGDFASFCTRSILAMFNHHGWTIEEWPHVQIEKKKEVDLKRARGEKGLKYEEEDDQEFAQMDEGNFLALSGAQYVCLFGQKLFRALNLHFSVSGLSQVSLSSLSQLSLLICRTHRA